MPRSAPNRFSTSKVAGSDYRLAGFHLREVEQVVHQVRQLFGRLADETELRLRLAVARRGRPSSSRSHRPMIEFTGVRNSCVMFERKRDLRSSARRRWSALLVELGVERDDAAIGVFELAIEVRRAPAACAADSSSAAQQLLVLLLDLLERGPGGRRAPHGFAISCARPLRDRRAARGQQLSRTTRVPAGADRSTEPSISRRAPTMPEAHAGRQTGNRPPSTSSRCAIPGPIVQRRGNEPLRPASSVDVRTGRRRRRRSGKRCGRSPRPPSRSASGPRRRSSSRAAICAAHAGAP